MTQEVANFSLVVLIEIIRLKKVTHTQTFTQRVREIERKIERERE